MSEAVKQNGDRPLVSICIPAYNSTAHVEETVRSVLAQTYPNLEVIVVDDASSDNTFELVQAIGDPRIRLYRNEKNLGMAGNWNRTLSLAKGEFVKLMGADDLLMPDCIEKEAGALQANPSAVLSESDSAVVDAGGKRRGTYRRYRMTGLVPGRTVAISCTRSIDLFGSPVANMIRRSVLADGIAFDPSFVYIIDYDFFMTIAPKGDIFIIHESLNAFRVHKSSNTSQVMGGGKERAYVAEHRKLLEKHKDALGLTRFDIARSMLIRRVWSFTVSVFLRIFVR